MAEITSGIRLTADAQGLVGGSGQSADALKRVEEQARRTGQAFTDMGRASRTAVDDQRRATDELRASIEAQRLAREADAARRFESTGLAAQLLAQRQAQAAVNAEIEAGSGAMRRSTAEAMAMSAAQGGLRSAMSALVGLFTGPAGVISVIAAGALSWVSFGTAAEDAGKKAEEAGKKAKAALELTGRQLAQQNAAAIGLQIQADAAAIADLEQKKGMSHSDEYRGGLDRQIAAIQARMQIRAGEAARILGGWPNPEMSIQEASEGLRTPGSARREFDERVRNLYAAYGRAIDGNPEGAAAMQAELLEQYGAARRGYDSQMKSFEPKVARERGDNGAAQRRAEAEAMREAAEAAKAEGAAVEANLDAVARMTSGKAALIAQYGAEREALELEASLVGASTAEREKAIAFRRIEQQARAASITASAEEIARIEEMVEAQKRLVGQFYDDQAARDRSRAAAEAARRQAQAEAAEWNNAARDMERALADSLMRGGKRALDYIQDIFRTAILQPIFRPVAQAATGFVQGVMGNVFGGGGGGGGGLGGGLGFPSPASFMNFGFGGGGAGVAAAEIAALTGSGTAAGASVGAASGLSAAMPWIGGALAIGSLLGVFGDDGDKRKQPGVVLKSLGGGRYGIGNTDLDGSEANEPFLHSFTAALSDAAQYDPSILDQYVDQWVMGSPGDTAQSLVQRLLGNLAPAAQSASSRNAGLLARLNATGAIGGNLRGYLDSMTTSEYLSPTARLAGAQGLFDSTLEAALAGDTDAAGRLSGAASTLLSSGRDVYASGPQFQALFTETNRRMIDVLQANGEAQADVLAEMPESIRKGAENTVNELRAMRKDIIEGLQRLNDGLRGLGPLGA